MNIITVNPDNIEREHICCAISDKKGETCVSSKKAWLKERFQDGVQARGYKLKGTGRGLSGI